MQPASTRARAKATALEQSTTLLCNSRLRNAQPFSVCLFFSLLRLTWVFSTTSSLTTVLQWRRSLLLANSSSVYLWEQTLSMCVCVCVVEFVLLTWLQSLLAWTWLQNSVYLHMHMSIIHELVGYTNTHLHFSVKIFSHNRVRYIFLFLNYTKSKRTNSASAR